MASPTDRFFSKDYQEARGKFLAAAEAAGAELEHHELPGHRGPDGKPLFMDLAWAGPADADVVLLSLSGTHGVEGFCGSAAQCAWLDQRPYASLPPKVALLLVHAVNPFGFAHFSRYNEGNVDLNRNFIDFSQPLPENPLYEELYQLTPRRVGHDEDLVEEVAQVLEAFWAKHGDWAASDAASRGQYSRPVGTQFGGHGPQWSRQILTSRIQARCVSARHIVYLDWHTLIRIGDGKLVFLCFNQTGDALFNRAGSWWSMAAIDRRAVDKQWGDGLARAERRPSRHGLVMWGLQHAVAPKADLAGAVIEFCADGDLLRSDLRSNARLGLYERWLVQTRNYDTPTGRFLTAYLRESVCPTRASFQEKAIDIALTTYAQAFEGAKIWAEQDRPAEPGWLVRSSAFE